MFQIVSHNEYVVKPKGDDMAKVEQLGVIEQQHKVLKRENEIMEQQKIAQRATIQEMQQEHK